MRLSDFMDSNLKYIKDLIMFLRMRGIQEISTAAVLKELERKGITTTYDELFEFISKMDIIDDVSADMIKFKQNSEDKELKSDEKLDMSKEAVASMARRARRRREQK